MSAVRRRPLVAALAIGGAVIAATASCGDGALPGAADGLPCAADRDCAGGACLADFPGGGACSRDCSSAPCPTGEVCQALGDRQLCIAACRAATDCKKGAMCWKGACLAACASDAACGPGFTCRAGQCGAATDGKPLGSPCAADKDCASRLCDPVTATCRRACTSDDACDPGETCFLNPYSGDGSGDTTAVRPVCAPVRAGGKAAGSPCAKHADCARGACILGTCSALCEVNAQCKDASLSCQKMVAPVDNGAPIVHTCLLDRGTLTVELGMGGGGPVGLPSNARGVNLYVEGKGMDIGYYAGLAYLDAPDGTELYTPPKTVADYYALPLRYEPSEGTSMALLPNGPAVKLAVGLFDFQAFDESTTGLKRPFTTRLRVKLAPSPPVGGHVPLHVFLTDLSGAPCQFGPGNQAFEQTLRSVFAQAGIQLTAITYAASSASSSITVPQTGIATELDQLLQQATTGDAPDALELVVIKRIYSKGSAGEVLGIAGGVPGSTGIPGTPHSGAAVSLSPLCQAGPKAFADTAGHELAHTLGLFHNVEMDGHHSPLGDDVADGAGNLMYWEEDSGQHLSHAQVSVLLANPAVAP